MPILWLALGIILCGLKFLPNIATPGSALQRDLALIPQIRAEMANDPRMIDARQRLEAEGRPAHDLTNYAIEVFRFLFKTWELNHPHEQWVASFVVKAVSFLIIGPWLLFAAFKIIKLFW